MKKGKMQKVQLKNKSTFGNEKKNMEVESYLRMGKRGKVREIFSSRIFIDCCFALPSTKRSRRAEENRRRAASGEGKERHKISNLEAAAPGPTRCADAPLAECHLVLFDDFGLTSTSPRRAAAQRYHSWRIHVARTWNVERDGLCFLARATFSRAVLHVIHQYSLSTPIFRNSILRDQLNVTSVLVERARVSYSGKMARVCTRAVIHN